MRSHTGEQLAPILAGKRGEREVFDAKEEGKKREGDLTMADVGREAKMPWETDGRQWHLHDRIAHSGNPCKWEGVVLERIVERLEEFQSGSASTASPKKGKKAAKKKAAGRKTIKGIVRGSDLLEAAEIESAASETKLTVNWNDPSTVEVTGEDKKLGWFLHALTRDEWLLKLYFRVDKKTFDQADLERRLNLKHVDEIDELPVYGRGQRVRVKNSRGPFQEVLITVHWLKEIDTPEFWQFLREARDSYLRRVESASTDVKDVSPWKVLGRKWHLMRKGFPANKRARWKVETLEALFELMEKHAPSENIVWNERQFVRYRFEKGKKDWAVVRTKSRTHIELTVMPESGEIGTGEIADVASECEVFEAKDGRSAVRLKFRNLDQIQSPKLTAFLEQCRAK